MIDIREKSPEEIAREIYETWHEWKVRGTGVGPQAAKDKLIPAIATAISKERAEVEKLRTVLGKLADYDTYEDGLAWKSVEIAREALKRGE